MTAGVTVVQSGSSEDLLVANPNHREEEYSDDEVLPGGALHVN
jgi:hypothetical protein